MFASIRLLLLASAPPRRVPAFLSTWAVLLFFGKILFAQPCGGPGCIPHGPIGPAPVLYARVIGPAGSRAIFYEGPRPRSFETPVTVGLRPGYVYRFKLSDLENHPKETLFPTLEVVGSLMLPPPLLVANFPVPLLFTPEDIERALAGAFITKVIYLENPEKAVPLQTRPDEPLVSEVKNERELLAEARDKGRPLVIVRLGERQVAPHELAGMTISGTILLPGDRILGPPAQPPCRPWDCVRMFDPVIGAQFPDEECMHDGGDVGQPAGIGRDGELRGLDPSDSVAEYTDASGRKRIAVSNRVCLCVPRFNVVRTELMPVGFDTTVGPAKVDVHTPPAVTRATAPPLAATQNEQPEAVLGPQRPSILKEINGPLIFEQELSTGLIVGEQAGQVVVGVCKHEVEKPTRPLVLCKTVDRKEAEIGSVVTFTLKYTNPGGQPITNVVVNDSLTGRLEYVPGSAKSERNAVFTTQENEAGSQILRWEISGVLQPGQSGTVKFQARVR